MPIESKTNTKWKDGIETETMTTVTTRKLLTMAKSTLVGYIVLTVLATAGVAALISAFIVYPMGQQEQAEQICSVFGYTGRVDAHGSTQCISDAHYYPTELIQRLMRDKADAMTVTYSGNSTYTFPICSATKLVKGDYCYDAESHTLKVGK